MSQSNFVIQEQGPYSTRNSSNCSSPQDIFKFLSKLFQFGFFFYFLESFVTYLDTGKLASFSGEFCFYSRHVNLFLTVSVISKSMYFTVVYKQFWVLFTIVATYRINNNVNVTILSSGTVVCSDIGLPTFCTNLPYLLFFSCSSCFPTDHLLVAYNCWLTTLPYFSQCSSH